MEEMTQEKFLELTKQAQEAKRNVFVLIEDGDGNWRGTTNKAGKPVFVRDIGPETVLQLLLTHNGK